MCVFVSVSFLSSVVCCSIVTDPLGHYSVLMGASWLSMLQQSLGARLIATCVFSSKLSGGLVAF